MSGETAAPWRWRHFSRGEMCCRLTGACAMDPVFMDRLDELRERFGKPLAVTSGFRSLSHPDERGKTQGGAHTLGLAVDFAVRGTDAWRLIRIAMEMGFAGIGVNQKGDERFIHLDDVPNGRNGLPRPTVWSY